MWQPETVGRVDTSANSVEKVKGTGVLLLPVLSSFRVVVFFLPFFWVRIDFFLLCGAAFPLASSFRVVQCFFCIITVIEIVSPGYECYASVTCSVWLKLARQIQNMSTRVSRTVELRGKRVQTR